MSLRNKRPTTLYHRNVCQVGVSDEVWAQIERHFHVYRVEKSGMVRGFRAVI